MKIISAFVAFLLSLGVPPAFSATVLNDSFEGEDHGGPSVEVSSTDNFWMAGEVNFISNSAICHSGNNCLSLVGSKTDYIFSSGSLWSKYFHFEKGDKIELLFFAANNLMNLSNGYADIGYSLTK